MNHETYVVIATERARTRLETHFHANGIVFSKKASETGAMYIAEMNEAQKKRVEAFKGVEVQNVLDPDLAFELDSEGTEATMKADFPFPNIEPDSPPDEEVKQTPVDLMKQWYTSLVLLVTSHPNMASLAILLLIIILILF